MTLKLFTDGGARGNPGPAGIGAILFEDDKLIWFESEYIGKATNNYAEYKAILLGLQKTLKIYPDAEIICHLDSELVVKQLNGEYKVKNKPLKILNDKIQDLIVGKTIIFKHVYREDNKFADKLVNISLDARE